MKALYTLVFICSSVIRVFPQYMLCPNVPFQYQSDSISFGNGGISGLNDSVMLIPISNLSDTTYFNAAAKLVAVSSLPGGTAIIDSTGWKPFATDFDPGHTDYVRVYFEVDSLIPPEYTTTFQLWVRYQDQKKLDSCVFTSPFTINMNYQVIPAVAADNNAVVADIYPIPAANVLHFFFKPETVINPMVVIHDVSGRQIMQQKANAPDWDMDVSSITPGIYFVEITDGDNSLYTRKIVIQR